MSHTTKFILVYTILFFGLQLNAQFKGGIRAGLSTFDVEADGLSLKGQDGENLGLTLKNADYNFHGGLWMRIGEPFFIQPEVLLNASQVTYELEDFGNLSTYGELLKESYLQLDIPVMVGFKLGPVRLLGGPVAHIALDQTSELSNIKGFSEDFSKLTLGYQAGLGLDIGKVVLEFRYEGNLERFGSHIRFFGDEYAFTDRPGRLIGSVGYRF